MDKEQSDMDIESDESERWEDFFGSTTDLSPTLIGYYDRLSTNSSTNSFKAIDTDIGHDNKVSIGNKVKIPDEINHNRNIQDDIKAQPVSNQNNNTYQKSTIVTGTTKHRMVKILSPNVQRIALHSNDEEISVDTKNTINNSEITVFNQQQKVFTKKISLVDSKTSSFIRQLAQHTQIPLSKNTCKLSQSGHDLVVDRFELLDDIKTPTRCPTTHIDNSATPIESISPSDDYVLTSDNFNEKDVDNNVQNVLKNFDTPLDTVNCNYEKEIFIKSTSNSYIKNLVKRYQSASGNSSSIITENGKSSFAMKTNENNPTKNVCNIPISQNFETESINEAKNPLYEFSFHSNGKVRNPQASELSTPSQLSYLRSKSVRDQMLRTNLVETCDKPTIDNVDSEIITDVPKDESIENNNITTTSCTENNKLSKTLHESTGKTIPKKTEISHLQHRPLSASSICSTSSSSSSGSEHLTGKFGVSYLASVESLADHSEAELVNNSNLPVSKRAALEIIDSERSYVDDLGQVIKGYLEDWQERACLKVDELKILFSNIQEIYNFNSILLKRLINASNDPIQIAKCFIELKEGFDVYTVYCTSYPESISLLTSLLQASYTNALLTSTQKFLRHNLPLGSYLLKPVQRILKYHLLLDNLRKHCEYEEVAQAHDLMTKVARNIDQVKKNLEHERRVKQLAGILDGWLGPELTVLGDLRLEGSLMENNKPRFVFLFQTMLIITKPKEDTRLQFKTYIHCKNLMLVEHLRGEPTSFQVIPYNNPKDQIKLTAKNRDLKLRWVKQIKYVMIDTLNIPNRARELVLNLSYEEERTPDKNSWKWGSNTHSATPEYLERRIQTRRSEMRYRPKKTRKNVTESLSLDSSDIANNNLKSKALEEQNFLNIKQAANENIKKPNKIICDHRSEKCSCAEVKNELNSTLSKKRAEYKQSKKNDSADEYGKLKTSSGRSKSEPRLPDTFNITPVLNRHKNLTKENSKEVFANENLYKFSTLGRPKSKNVEVKMYNTKTLPKRIANLKKNRGKTLKETSTFYCTLSDNNELKITESTDNLSSPLIFSKNDCDEIKINEIDNSSFGENDLKIEEADNCSDKDNKKDAEIISELIMENRDFNRILKKPIKKKSIDNDKHINLEAIQNVKNSVESVLDSSDNSSVSKNNDQMEPSNILSRLEDIQNDLTKPEPIYETLLRNVHVPYKYAPPLNRSMSQQCKSPVLIQKTKKDIVDSPESDYVTLAYSTDGLRFIGDHLLVTVKDENSIFRNSDSNINYNKIDRTASNVSDISNGNFTDVDDSIKSAKETDDGCRTPINKERQSNDSISISSKVSKISERSVSDVSEMCRQSVIYKQGSENLGSRIAHLDYADPRTLFQGREQSNILINKAVLLPQRDSVFSLTSSSDSVCDTKSSNNLLDDRNNSSIIFSDENNYYEKNVEECLENEGFFRDSAIYSDDNERKYEYYDEDGTLRCQMHNSSSPYGDGNSPAPAQNTLTPPINVVKKPLRSPPPLPIKPSFLNITEQKRYCKEQNVDQSVKDFISSPQSIQKECKSPRNTSSWVKQQVKKFE